MVLNYTFAEQAVAVETTCEDCHLKGKEVEGKKATYPRAVAHRLHQDVGCSTCHAGYYHV